MLDNMGGLRKLYYIDADDFVSLTPDENNLNTLVLEEGAAIDEIEFTSESGKISETEDITDNGTVYNFEATCIIPKCGPDNLNPLGDLRQKRLLIMGEDNNGNFWLAGAPGSYFDIVTTSNTGQATQDLNARQLKISAGLMTSSVFIETPFPA
jgi:hypothetical protein